MSVLTHLGTDTNIDAKKEVPHGRFNKCRSMRKLYL